MSNSTKFKANDYVKIIDGTEIDEINEPAVGWQGLILKAPSTPKGSLSDCIGCADPEQAAGRIP
ncbi:MAG: hypothetical protein SH848_03235 [Saprospiraceae bacterium]|nr:hypothetical protein [Saprospiraceae bacterium]MDZ4702915.1 hypothetical protein [Saprospiraceae bacterium]